MITGEHPGAILARRIEASGFTANMLSLSVGMPASRISRIINGVARITADTALRLAHALDTDAKYWLDLQALHDLRVAQARIGDKVQKLPRLKRKAAAR